MKQVLLVALLLGSFTSAMQIPTDRTVQHVRPFDRAQDKLRLSVGGSDGEDKEELPQELLALWRRFHEVKGYYTHVFGVAVDKSDLTLVQLRLKAIKTEVDALALAIDQKAMHEEQRAYILGNIKKLKQKLHYFPL